MLATAVVLLFMQAAHAANLACGAALLKATAYVKLTEKALSERQISFADVDRAIAAGGLIDPTENYGRTHENAAFKNGFPQLITNASPEMIQETKTQLSAFREKLRSHSAQIAHTKDETREFLSLKKVHDLESGKIKTMFYKTAEGETRLISYNEDNFHLQIFIAGDDKPVVDRFIGDLAQFGFSTGSHGKGHLRLMADGRPVIIQSTCERPRPNDRVLWFYDILQDTKLTTLLNSEEMNVELVEFKGRHYLIFLESTLGLDREVQVFSVGNQLTLIRHFRISDEHSGSTQMVLLKGKKRRPLIAIKMPSDNIFFYDPLNSNDMIYYRFSTDKEFGIQWQAALDDKDRIMLATSWNSRDGEYFAEIRREWRRSFLIRDRGHTMRGEDPFNMKGFVSPWFKTPEGKWVIALTRLHDDTGGSIGIYDPESGPSYSSRTQSFTWWPWATRYLEASVILPRLGRKPGPMQWLCAEGKTYLTHASEEMADVYLPFESTRAIGRFGTPKMTAPFLAKTETVYLEKLERYVMFYREVDRIHILDAFTGAPLGPVIMADSISPVTIDNQGRHLFTLVSKWATPAVYTLNRGHTSINGGRP